MKLIRGTNTIIPSYRVLYQLCAVLTKLAAKDTSEEGLKATCKGTRLLTKRL